MFLEFGVTHVQGKSWPSVERQILPTWSQLLPSLGLEFVRILAIKVLASVHRVERIADRGIFGMKRRLAIRTATEG
jgi:hypothetical protein